MIGNFSQLCNKLQKLLQGLEVMVGIYHGRRSKASNELISNIKSILKSEELD
jgi:hypothetical protein